MDSILIRGCQRRVYLWRIRTFVGRPVTFQRAFPRPTICFCCFRPAFGWLLILALLLYSIVVRWEEGDFCCLLPIHHFLQWMNVVVRAIVHTGVVIFHQLLLLIILPVILFLRSLFCDELHRTAEFDRWLMLLLSSRGLLALPLPQLLLNRRSLFHPDHLLLSC